MAMQHCIVNARTELHRVRLLADEVQNDHQLNMDKFYAKVRETKDRIKQLRKEMEQLFDRCLLQIDLQENSVVHAFAIVTKTCKELRSELECQTECLELVTDSPLKCEQILSESRTMCENFEQTLKEIKEQNINFDVNLSTDQQLLILIEKVKKLVQSEIVESDEIMGKETLRPPSKADEIMEKEITKPLSKADEIMKKEIESPRSKDEIVEKETLRTLSKGNKIMEKETLRPPSKTFLNIQTLSPLKEASTIRIKNDDKVPLITGCCWIPGGYVILCDNNNRKLKVLDQNLHIKLNALCTNSPFDIALKDESTCIFTIPDAKSIQFVTVQPGLRFKHIKCLKLRCFGIEVHGKNIFVCIDDLQQSVKCVKILSLEGNCVSYITHQGAGAPRYLCISADGMRIYYTGGLDKDVFINCITTDGFGIFSVSSSDLKSPRSVVMDSDGNAIVADDKAKCLHTVSAEGVFGLSMLVENETELGPTSCCVNRTEDLILVAFWQTHSSKVILYKLVYQASKSE